jgi:hypothetical protein
LSIKFCPTIKIGHLTDIVIDDYLGIYKNEIGELLLCGTIKKANIEIKVNLLDLRFLKAIDFINLANIDSPHCRQFNVIKLWVLTCWLSDQILSVFKHGRFGSLSVFVR